MENVIATETSSMSVAHVAEQVPSTSVDVLISQRETVTVTETSSTSVALVAEQVSQRETVTATETSSTSVAHVAEQVSQRETVTATETNSTPSAFVVETAKQTPMAMASVTMTKCQDVKTIQHVTTTYSLRIQTTAASLPKEFAKHALGKMMELEPSSTTTATETAYVTM